METDIIDILYPYEEYYKDSLLSWVVDGRVEVGIFNVVHNGVGGKKKGDNDDRKF